MSVARPTRYLLSRGLAGAAAPAIAPLRCHGHALFHSSAPLESRKPRFKNVRAQDMGLVTPEKVQEFTKQAFPEYTPEELDVLRTRYTPEQMAALEAGEAAIDPKDLTIQARIREDPYRHLYLDDFSRILPVVDKRPRPLRALPPPDVRFMTEEEHALDVEKVLGAFSQQQQQPEGVDGKPDDKTALEEAKFFQDPHTLVNAPLTNSALAPGLGKKLSGVAGMYASTSDDILSPVLLKASKQLGLSAKKIRKIQSMRNKVIVARGVVNQTRLGKVKSDWRLAIAGNCDGWVGIGEAKSTEPEVAQQKACDLAILNLRPIRRYEDRTIYGKVTAKVGATIVTLEARPPGFGIRASPRFFEIFRAAGIQDIAAKMPRGRNPMNSVKACMKALMNQPDPEEIALGRGKKLIDLRKVYHGKEVL